MAFGIDDALATAAAGINLTETVVRTVEAYRQKGMDVDIELLIEEVRITSLHKIDEADFTLATFERTLSEKGINLDMPLQELISSTPIWKPFEQYRLRRFRDSFNELADATYKATDDIAALARCRDQTGEMGIAVVESANSKHKLQAELLNAESVRSAIALIRDELVRHKETLTRA